MAIVRKSLNEARFEARVDLDRLQNTTKADIRRQMIEDGENPDDVSARFEPSIKSLRMMLGIEQESFSRLIQVPLATLAEWEEGRAEIDPATRLLIKLIAKDPSAIVRMLIELAIADPMIVSN